jgi:hypothetical protein
VLSDIGVAQCARGEAQSVIGVAQSVKGVVQSDRVVLGVSEGRRRVLEGCSK